MLYVVVELGGKIEICVRATYTKQRSTASRHNSPPALLTASTLRRRQIGAVSIQDQTMSRFTPLRLELFLDMETRHRTESLLCFVVIAAYCSIVVLIVGASRARQHTSSCVWNRGRLFINKPPHTRPRPEGSSCKGGRQRWTAEDTRILGGGTGWAWVAHFLELVHETCVFYRKILKTGGQQLLFCYEEVFTVESSGFVWWRKAAGWCQISKRRQHEGEKSVFGSHVLLLHLHLQIDADQVGVGSSVNSFFRFLVQPAIVFCYFCLFKELKIS